MVLDLAWLLGVLTLALLSPGPDFLLVVKNSMGGSRSRALGTVAGIATGLALQTTLVSLGFAALSPQHVRTVQLVGVALLGWIGLRALLARGDSSGAGSVATPPPARSAAGNGYLEGFLCNATNPKAFVFFVGLFAQVLGPERPAAWRVILPIVVVIHGLICWTLIVLALQSPLVARRLGRAQHWLPRVFGGALVVVAAVVLVEALR